MIRLPAFCFPCTTLLQTTTDTQTSDPRTKSCSVFDHTPTPLYYIRARPKTSTPPAARRDKDEAMYLRSGRTAHPTFGPSSGRQLAIRLTRKQKQPSHHDILKHMSGRIQLRIPLLLPTRHQLSFRGTQPRPCESGHAGCFERGKLPRKDKGRQQHVAITLSQGASGNLAERR
jgi:hypothetical protein